MGWAKVSKFDTGETLYDSRWMDLDLADTLFITEFEAIRDRFPPNSRERKLAERVMDATIVRGLLERDDEFARRMGHVVSGLADE